MIANEVRTDFAPGWAGVSTIGRNGEKIELRLCNGKSTVSAMEGLVELRFNGTLVTTTVDQLLEMMLEARKAADATWK